VSDDAELARLRRELEQLREDCAYRLGQLRQANAHAARAQEEANRLRSQLDHVDYCLDKWIHGAPAALREYALAEDREELAGAP
jgi:chromosome segregation ATPase